MSFTRITRTIESPGVEILETDLSQRVSPPAGTKIYTMGYADEGPTDEVLQISSMGDFEAVYGTPKNAAERYFYHTVKGALNSPATIYTNRIPYGPDAGIGFGSQYTVLAFPVTAFGDSTPLYTTLEPILSTQFSDSSTLSTTHLPTTGTVVSEETFIAITSFNVGLLSAFNVDFVPGFTDTFDISAGVYFVGKPTQFALNETQYQELINGSLFEWSDKSTGTFTNINDLSSAGLLVVNKAQTVTDPQYNGYYIALGDNLDTEKDGTYNKLTFAYTVTQSGDGIINYTTIPNTVLNFSLSSTGENVNSLSRILETQTTSYDIDSQEFSDHLLVNTYKLRKAIGGDDQRKLAYVIDSKYIGSIDSYRTISTQGGVGEQSFIELESKDTNYQVLVNPYISNKDGTNGGRSSLSNLNTLKKVRVLTESLKEKSFQKIGLPLLANTPQEEVSTIIDEAEDAIGYCNGLFPLGVYSDQKLTSKVVGNVATKVEKGLEKVRNKDLFDLDIFVEGGLGTIGVYQQIVGNEMFVDTNYPASLKNGIDEIKTSSPTGGEEVITNYASVLTKFTSFCNSMQEGGRGDCFFIADPVRWIFVEGKNLKTMQKTDAAFSTSIYYPMRNLYSQYNTNYGAVYANWFKVNDSASSMDVWVPASGFVAGKYAVNDALVGPWGAPAGFNRGLINNITDIAFTPNQKQRDDLYRSSFNPIVQFPGQGIAIFGQKTLQKKPSAFDRVNVRRLFLYAEKAVHKTMQFFVFENNTDFTRRRIVNTLNPFFERIQAAEGVYDYRVICNSDNNTPEVIDNNELIVTILLKAVRTGEFILVNFVATRTDTNFEELIG